MNRRVSRTCEPTACGSLQAPSGNLALLRAVSRNAPSGVEVVPFDRLADLPFFNPDLDTGDGPPAVDEWRRAVAGANALLIASPEYGHSLPGVVKNGIDWLIGPAELIARSSRSLRLLSILIVAGWD